MSLSVKYAPTTAPIESITLSCNDTPGDKLVINRAYDGGTAFRLKMSHSGVVFASKDDIRQLANELATFAAEVKS